MGPPGLIPWLESGASRSRRARWRHSALACLSPMAFEQHQRRLISHSRHGPLCPHFRGSSSETITATADRPWRWARFRRPSRTSWRRVGGVPCQALPFTLLKLRSPRWRAVSQAVSCGSPGGGAAEVKSAHRGPGPRSGSCKGAARRKKSDRCTSTQVRTEDAMGSTGTTDDHDVIVHGCGAPVEHAANAARRGRFARRCRGARHDPAVAQLLGDLRRRAEGAEPRDRRGGAADRGVITTNTTEQDSR